MTSRKVFVSCLFALSLSLGCGGEQETGTEASAAEASAAEESAPTGPACERAAECCVLYNQALNTPTTGCDSYAGRDESEQANCQRTLDMWRNGLEVSGNDIPAACR